WKPANDLVILIELRDELRKPFQQGLIPALVGCRCQDPLGLCGVLEKVSSFPEITIERGADDPVTAAPQSQELGKNAGQDDPSSVMGHVVQDDHIAGPVTELPEEWHQILALT